jgi:hypothetical protein
MGLFNLVPLDGLDQTGQLVASGGPGWLYALYLPAGLLAMFVLVPGGIAVVAMGLGKVPGPYLAFDPPPGWPDVPSGWLPHAGWTPDPRWPQAPANWNFLKRVSKSDPGGKTSRVARVGARHWEEAWYRALSQPAPRKGNVDPPR